VSVGSIPSVGSANAQLQLALHDKQSPKIGKARLAANSGSWHLLRQMNPMIQQVDHHMVGHCDCCDGYRVLEYHDSELGYLCFRCIDHLMVADIELNHGGYTLCRPGVKSPSAGLRLR
jgi:hypothetical protein